MLLDNLYILILVIALAITSFYLVFKMNNKDKLFKANELLIKEQQKREEEAKDEELEYNKYIHDIKIEEIKRKQEAKKHKLYKLNTNKVRYYIFDMSRLNDYSIKLLYKNIVIKNLWLNEPFHSVFFKLLQLLDNNELMIQDPNSDVLILNTRDQNNKIQKSKSYQVFSTIDFISSVFRATIDHILKFNKKDAQIIILAILIISIKKSKHYLNYEVDDKFIDSVFEDKDYAYRIQIVISQIDQNYKNLRFIKKVFSDVLRYITPQPFNDSNISQSELQLPMTVPKKVLKEI